MKVLYHASENKNLEIIKPGRTLSKDKYIGDYVFATANRKLAAMYLTTRGYPVLMEPKAPWLRLIICAEQEDYFKGDKGGVIYELPADSFKPTPQSGLEEYEFVSELAVKPLKKNTYVSSISAFAEEGLDLYFVTSDKFQKILDAKGKEREKILQTIWPTMI